MKFRHGPWAYNEFLAPLNMLKFRISSPCAKENRVFGFTAPPLHRRFGEPMARNSTVSLFPVSPERDLSEKWLEGISSSLHHRQSILNVPKIEVWKKSCSEGIKAMIVDPFVLPALRFQSLSTSYCRFHCRPLNHFGLSVSNQPGNCGVCVWNANLHHHSRPAAGTLNTTSQLQRVDAWTCDCTQCRCGGKTLSTMCPPGPNLLAEHDCSLEGLLLKILNFFSTRWQKAIYFPSSIPGIVW